MSKRRVKRIQVVFLIVMMVSINPVLASVTYKWFSTGECSGNRCSLGEPEASWVFSDTAVKNGVARNLTPGEVLAFEFDGPLSLDLTNDAVISSWADYRITFSADRNRIASIAACEVCGPLGSARSTVRFDDTGLQVNAEASLLSWNVTTSGDPHATFDGYWAVPVPSVVYVFGPGLVGLIGLLRCKNKVKVFPV